MRKIPTLFERDWDGDRSRVVDVVNPDCEWVMRGEGVATRKLDGTCCMIAGGVLYKRREIKAGKPEPFGFIKADSDPVTGKRVGWVEVGNGAEDKYYREAMSDDLSDGTFELVGPKIQGNPEHYERHTLVSHASVDLVFEDQPPRDYEGLRAWLGGRDIEGIVWHHPGGRMAKIKLRDFGLKRADDSESPATTGDRAAES